MGDSEEPSKLTAAAPQVPGSQSLPVLVDRVTSAAASRQGAGVTAVELLHLAGTTAASSDQKYVA